MKFLVRFNKDTNDLIDMQSVNQEVIHKYYDIEELQHKQGHTITYEYDKENNKVVGKYVPIPKTEVEKLQETVYALQEQMLNSGIGL